MGQFSLRTKAEAVLFMAFMVAGCGPTPSESYDLADVANVNAINALSKCTELEDRIDQIEYDLHYQ